MATSIHASRAVRQGCDADRPWPLDDRVTGGSSRPSPMKRTHLDSKRRFTLILNDKAMRRSRDLRRTSRGVAWRDWVGGSMRTGTVISLGASAVLGVGALIVARVWLPQSAAIGRRPRQAGSHRRHRAGGGGQRGHPLWRQGRREPPDRRATAGRAVPPGAFSDPSQLIKAQGGVPIALQPDRAARAGAAGQAQRRRAPGRPSRRRSTRACAPTRSASPTPTASAATCCRATAST